MKTAVITGTSSGIGKAVAKVCLELGYTVYGLSRSAADASPIRHERFFPLRCDVTKLPELRRAVESIRREHPVSLLVNNAGIGFFGPHEQIRPEQLAQMVSTNLQAPLLLTQMLLRDIKKTEGWVINISSVTAKKISTHGCAYAATKAGLSHFTASLFEEIRKTGAKAVAIQPDMTESAFYDHLDFQYDENPLARLTAECVADAVKSVLSQRNGTVIQEMTIRPQLNRIYRKK